MANEELFKKIADFAAAAYQADASSITSETTFGELGMRSMEMIALTSMIENELDVEVPTSEVMNMKTIGELVKRVEEEYEE